MPRLVIADPGDLLSELTGSGGAHWPPGPAGRRHHFMPRATELRRLTLPGDKRRPDDTTPCRIHHLPLVQCPGPIWLSRRMKAMRGGPFLVWTGEVIKTNDIALRIGRQRLDLVSGLWYQRMTMGRNNRASRALSVLPDISPPHRLIETRIIQASRQPILCRRGHAAMSLTGAALVEHFS
jgi:hypothetical protein